MSNRALFPLVALLVACSLLLVNSQFHARRLFIELERAQLRLEQSLLAKHARIDAMARSSLGMAPPGPGRTQYMTAGAH